MSSLSRIVVVVGTRPEAVKLAPVVHELHAAKWAQVRLVATAQHRELLDAQLAHFGLVVDRDLDVMRPGQSLAELTGRLFTALDPVLADERPDLVLAQGDTTTVLVAAMAAFYRGIPFGHVEAGLRTGDLAQPFPEEANRVLVARLATLHFAPTAGAREHLLREGVAADRVHVTGNPAIDALLWTAARTGPSEYTPAAGRHLVLVTAHRRESFGAPLLRVCAALRTLAARGDVDVLFPVHANPQVRDAVYHELAGVAGVRLVAPLAYGAMVAAMRASTLILTDSGGVQEEAPSLGKPVLVLRETTERPEGVAAGVAQIVGTDTGRIVAAATRLLHDGAARAAMSAPANPYGDGQAARRIVAVLQDHLRAGR